MGRAGVLLLLIVAQFTIAASDESAWHRLSHFTEARPELAGQGFIRHSDSNAADVFQLPLPEWSPHCLGFGSEWRYCNGTPLRACANGAVWLHTGADVVASAGEPVVAAGDGEIIGFLVDPTFRGGVLIRHATSTGTVITQYWHVWLRSGFTVGSRVTRGLAFATVADMGDKTHLHFAVFNGDVDAHAWNGALPPSPCSGFPAFPYKFVDPTAFIKAHAGTALWR